MARRVVTKADLDLLEPPLPSTPLRAPAPRALDTEAPATHPTPAKGGADSYLERLLKYIPMESVALFVTLDGIMRSSGPPAWMPWAVFAALLAITALYIGRLTKSRSQVVVSTLAIAVWMFALGGPFAQYGWYQPYMGAMLVPLFTVGAPLVIG